MFGSRSAHSLVWLLTNVLWRASQAVQVGSSVMMVAGPVSLALASP
ncbi:hypothetical protein MHAS44199_20440 [Mycolicibacterium hassiacum DSM 44199]|nr:hypothetical protein [Mycolicibacterium hassiacum DSM 44199]